MSRSCDSPPLTSPSRLIIIAHLLFNPLKGYLVFSYKYSSVFSLLYFSFLPVMNRSVASKFQAPVSYLPMFLSISATLLIEICLGYLQLAYSPWYFVTYFGNAL